jgi:hypothetical protein
MADLVCESVTGRSAAGAEPVTTEVSLWDILSGAAVFSAAGDARLYSSGIPGVFEEEKAADFYDEGSRTAFLKRLEKNRVLPKGGGEAALAELGKLPGGDEQRRRR